MAEKILPLIKINNLFLKPLGDVGKCIVTKLKTGLCFQCLSLTGHKYDALLLNYANIKISTVLNKYEVFDCRTYTCIGLLDCDIVTFTSSTTAHCRLNVPKAEKKRQDSIFSLNRFIVPSHRHMSLVRVMKLWQFPQRQGNLSNHFLSGIF